MLGLVALRWLLAGPVRAKRWCSPGRASDAAVQTWDGVGRTKAEKVTNLLGDDEWLGDARVQLGRRALAEDTRGPGCLGRRGWAERQEPQA